MINKEGKLFGKISIVDIVAVLAIIVAGFGIYSRFFAGNEKVEVTKSHIEYKMKVSEVRIGTVDALKNYGGSIYDTTTKEYMGKIINAEYTEAKKESPLANGTVKESLVPERYDVILTVSVDDGKINDSGFFTANNQKISAGSNYVFESKAAKTTGKIIDVYEVAK